MAEQSQLQRAPQPETMTPETSVQLLPSPIVGEFQLAAYRRILARAADVMGDATRASHWLSRRSIDFEGKSPLEALADGGYEPEGILEVLGRIEHGVYF